jgi:hypothetical protein
MLAVDFFHVEVRGRPERPAPPYVRARRVGVSRSTPNRRFLTEVGHSPPTT